MTGLFGPNRNKTEREGERERELVKPSWMWPNSVQQESARVQMARLVEGRVFDKGS